MNVRMLYLVTHQIQRVVSGSLPESIRNQIQLVVSGESPDTTNNSPDRMVLSRESPNKTG